MKYFLLITILFAGILIYKNKSHIPTPSPSPSTVQISLTSTPIIDTLVKPVSEFKQRITKKFFGTYVTPQNSPVSPEKFTGFHTGVDIEYEDISDDVPIYSIDDGQIIYSGHVNGYGGFIAIQYLQYIGIYGHLRPSSLITNHIKVKKGQNIAVLGTGYSSETDGERKHLHFAILKGQKLDFRGYVQNQSDLSFWLNPLTLYP